jgi:hypothetical protein
MSFENTDVLSARAVIGLIRAWYGVNPLLSIINELRNSLLIII